MSNQTHNGDDVRLVRWYRGAWQTIDELSHITDELAKESMLRGMNSFNELFSAFIAKVLALLAPLPSAVNMGTVLVVAHDYDWWQGALLAVILDFAGYGITEKTVAWWFDDRQPDGKKYTAIVLTVSYYIMLFVIVVWLKGWGVEIIFPILSCILAGFYALVRHDELRTPKRKSAKSQRNLSANESAKAQVVERSKEQESAILDAIQSESRGTGDLAVAFKVSPNTMRNRLYPLVEEGLIEKQGRKWARVSPALPEPPTIHLNGNGAAKHE